MGHPSARYFVDPDDPRAPPQDVWDAMTPDERAEVLASLPSDFPVSEAAPPEGDPHFEAVVNARQVLRGHFGRIGGRVYIASDLPVYYPGERMFAPDLIAIREVETHPREHWTVSHEGKGLDLAIEFLWSGRRAKDLRDNVHRYARLGIPEYFVFDLRRSRLYGYTLQDAARAYEPVVPQGGRYASRVLGLELTVEGSRLRFLYAMSPVPDMEEMIARLDTMVDEMTEKHDRAERRAEEAERRLAEALAELARLKSTE